MPLIGIDDRPLSLLLWPSRLEMNIGMPMPPSLWTSTCMSAYIWARLAWSTSPRAATSSWSNFSFFQVASADYDERQFADPFTFDIHRWPNDHVAFNLRSPHLCLGAQLARMEIKLLFQELLPLLKSVQLAGPVERLRSNFICGMKRLPVQVSWA